MFFLGPVGLVSSNLAYFLLVVCDLSIRRVGFTNRNFENWACGRRFPSGFVVVGCFSRFCLFTPEGHIFFVFFFREHFQECGSIDSRTPGQEMADPGEGGELLGSSRGFSEVAGASQKH